MADTLMFLWIQGIDGLSQDPRHLREIDVESFGFGHQKYTGTFGSTTGKADYHDFEFMKRFDRLSAILHQAATSGKHFSKAILTVERNLGGRSAGEILRFVMTDIVVTKVTPNYAKQPTGNDLETIELNFATISWKYKE